MRRVSGIVSICFSLASLAGVTTAALTATLDDYLNTPVWYLSYQVTLKASYETTNDVPVGTSVTTINLERVMSDQKEFNLRSAGMGPLSMRALADPDKASAADAGQTSMKVLNSMDTCANWLAAGAGANPNATDADIAKDTEPSSPSRIDYTRVDSNRDFVDETGTVFDVTTTTTIKGTGKVLVMGMGTVILEMNKASKTYMLTLPFGSSPTGPEIKREIVTVARPKGKAPDEQRESGALETDFPARLELNPPQPDGIDGGVLIRGTLDPAAGKIAGQQTFNVNFNDGPYALPGTLTFTYALTTMPPAK
ncbi:MAG TPA: hypothetical protein VFH88_03980 [Candidatus Krumholzibacteria bacterium]|nr:hypothetical protein [Candidatus Krumholzibacteria bacterium]